MTATTAILAAFSPLLVALVRKLHWPQEVVELGALLIVGGLYVLGQFLDGVLIWPLPEGFWVGLAAAWGVQQLSYKLVWRHTAAVERLEEVGSG
jgi:hypothetical protein